MSLFRFFFCFICFSSIFISQALAFRSVDFENNTYFTADKYDRIYFDREGKFYQQLEDQWQNVSAGQIIEGEWSIKNDQLCLRYLSINYLKQQELCFDVKIGNGKTTVSDSSKTVFIWVDRRNGNWLLKPEFLKKFKRIGSEETSLDLTSSANRFIGKVYTDSGKYISYTLPNLTGLIYNREKKEMTSFKVEISRGLIIMLLDTKPQKTALEGVWTLGKEFIEDHGDQLFFYKNKHDIKAESDAVFELVPFDKSPHKDIFLPYLNTKGRIDYNKLK